MRGWVLESIGRAGALPDEALPYVLEELETAHDPYLLAVAASVLRTAPQPLPSFSRALHTASQNARAIEAPVMLGVYGGMGGSGAGATSPVRELAAAIEWMGPNLTPLSAGCCPELPESITRFFRRKPSSISGSASDRALHRVALQDQNGETKTWRERFGGRTSVVAFFYTRCDNPLKCTLTIAKLSRVQRILQERGLFDQIGVAGITYDPGYDTPDRLLRYGRNRGFQFDAGHALLRAPEGFDDLLRRFELGVSFFDSLVSRHRIEVFILDREGSVAYTFQRLNWSEEQAADEAAALLSAPSHSTSMQPMFASFAPIAGLAASAIPKCPMCWATYLSLLGVAGVFPAIDPIVMKLVAAALLTVNLTLVLWRVRAAGWHISHTLSLAGVILIAANVLRSTAIPALAAGGASLMLLASILSVRRR
jgi:protein SCO1/2